MRGCAAAGASSTTINTCTGRTARCSKDVGTYARDQRHGISSCGDVNKQCRDDGTKD